MFCPNKTNPAHYCGQKGKFVVASTMASTATRRIKIKKLIILWQRSPGQRQVKKVLKEYRPEFTRRPLSKDSQNDSRSADW